MLKNIVNINSNKTQLGLDTTSEISFLSHGHLDHVQVIKKGTTVIATDPTFDLAAKSKKKFVRAKPSDIDKTIRLHDAGHILGSSQISVDSDGKRVLFTGDIKAGESIFFKGADIPEADMVIMDGTYNHPDYVFPNYFETVRKIGKWITNNDYKIRIIGGYPIGKTQELIKIINDYGYETPVISKNSEAYTKVYVKHGIKLNYVVTGTEEADEIMKKPFVAIVPPRKSNIFFARKLRYAFDRPVVSATVTGWTLKFKYNSDVVFPLSDHSDYNEIWKFIEGTGAKDVRFFCGPRT